MVMIAICNNDLRVYSSKVIERLIKARFYLKTLINNEV